MTFVLDFNPFVVKFVEIPRFVVVILHPFSKPFGEKYVCREPVTNRNFTKNQN